MFYSLYNGRGTLQNLDQTAKVLGVLRNYFLLAPFTENLVNIRNTVLNNNNSKDYFDEFWDLLCKKCCLKKHLIMHIMMNR